ncbi:GNAT family N-acetyltransferase [Metallibacterium sp.]|uniref:GNAT family N-acetyltransferase n=1 Tax=Metallibacterium sp. TaxID=2940281 RepID=UPI002613C311|nr:GNAT family N-acetyltransferase [Metallibacterium sp.]
MMHAAQLLIRDATPDDHVFLVGCAAAMALETEHKQLDAARLARGVQTLLAQPARGFYLIAERAGTRVGTLMVSYEWSDWRGGDFWWIQSVYVLPEARRGGVYRALHMATRTRAQSAGAVGLRLYVEQDNTRAQRSYAALGMRRTAYALFEQEFGTP